MKRIISLFLVCCICFIPALGAEAGFSDVPAGSWYAGAVETCVDAGLMSGTGGGRFSPDGPLSRLECFVLAARLHQIQNGGDGVLPQAPADWGKLTLTTADGTVISDYGDSDTWTFASYTHYGGGYLYYPLTTPALDAWGKTQHNTSATLTVDGVAYPGRVEHTMPFDVFCLVFYPEDQEAVSPVLHRAVYQRPAPGKWYRDAFYYAERRQLFDALPEINRYDTDTATRGDFAQFTATAAGALEAINRIDALPDTADGTVLALYNAGILNGLDGYGTFGGELGLTRAEAAVMLSRVLEPETRLAFTPSPLPYRDYTLTELDTRGGYSTDASPSTGLLALYFPDPDQSTSPPGTNGILYADGSLRMLEEGVMGYQIEETGLLLLTKIGPGGGNGVMDAASGEMVLPFGAYDSFTVTRDGHILLCSDQNAPDPVWSLRDRTGAEIAVLTGAVDWSNYNEGLAPRADPETGLWGYADVSGAWAIPARWDYAGPFRDGYAVVTDRAGGHRGAIDRTGAVCVTTEYESLFNLGGGLFSYRDWATRDTGWVRPGGESLRSGYAASNAKYSGGYIAIGNRYLNADGVPVTPEFDWVGPAAEDGSSFVGLNGKVYRLQFE